MLSGVPGDTVLGKVAAFIIRRQAAGAELLLFRHPYGGIQLPAGTMEAGETPEQAVLREGREESGLAGLRIVGYLGFQDQQLGEGRLATLRSSRVYSRPDTSSFAWAELRPGLWVRLERQQDGFAQVTYQEWDRWPDWQYVTYQITGWVPEDVLTPHQRRHFFHLAVDGEAPDGPWQVFDDNHRFELFWAPLADLPALVWPQNEWLDLVRDRLAGA